MFFRKHVRFRLLFNYKTNKRLFLGFLDLKGQAVSVSQNMGHVRENLNLYLYCRTVHLVIS